MATQEWGRSALAVDYDPGYVCERSVYELIMSVWTHGHRTKKAQGGLIWLTS